MARFELGDLPAMIWPVDAVEYHAADDLIGHSMIEDFRKNPRTYCDIYVTRRTPKPSPSRGMIIGSATHCATLEPGEFSKRYAVRPLTNAAGEPWNMRKPSHREEFNRFSQTIEDAGRNVLTPDEMRSVMGMRHALMQNEYVRAYLDAPGPVEQAVVWRDPVTLLLCKSLRDKYVEGERIILDIKTCVDASPLGFRSQALEYGYNRTAAWYLAGERLLNGEGDIAYIFAAVSKVDFSCAVYELPADDLQQAAEQNARALERVAECYFAGDWRPIWQKQITTLPLAARDFYDLV